jgi:hypothetical protein
VKEIRCVATSCTIHKESLLKCTLIFAEVLMGGGSSPGSATSDVLEQSQKSPTSSHPYTFKGSWE